MRWFEKDPRPVNLGLLTAVSVVGVVLMGWVSVTSKRLKRKLLEEEARRAMGEESVMPGGSVGWYGAA